MKTIFLFLCVVFLGIQSCGERTLIRHYYLLEFPEGSDLYADSTVLTTKICEIMDTEIPPAFAQLRIAVRKRSNEISYYQYNYWAMSPSDNLSFLLARQVETAGIFARSERGFLKEAPDFQIKSKVYNLEVLDMEDVYYAHLQMELDLIEFDSRQRLVSYSFDKTKALPERDLNLFASQLSVIFQEETTHFIKKIRTYLEENNTAVPAK
jgi:ABC-type uncharacterized transport system auxiliary subunit